MKNLVYLCVLKPSSHRTAEESLGVEYLASSLNNAGYHAEIRDLWMDESVTTEGLVKEILERKDEVLFVGTSSYMLNNKPTCELLKFLNKHGIKATSGGYGPTFEPGMFLNSGADVVIIGEGENSIVEVADWFNGVGKLEEIKGVCYLENGNLKTTEKRELIDNLNSISFPERPYLHISKKRKSTVNVLSSRGCLGHCAFCSIAANFDKQKGKRWRGRSVKNIVEELKILQAQGVTHVKFVDDSFLELERNEQWCKEFARQIKSNQINMMFRASLRADKINENSMQYLKDAGFFSYSVGLENGSPTALKRMHKLASIEDNEKAIEIFDKLGLYMQAGFILFDNKTTLKELEENHRFLQKHIELVSKGIFSEMFAAVGTEFTAKNIKEDGQKFCSNNLYLVEDLDARQVYDNLKKWQKHHSRVYDMVIDPISAPKAIPIQEMKKYYKIMIDLKQIDLNFMKDTISAVKVKQNIDEVYKVYEKKFSPYFDEVQNLVEKFYEKDGLVYDANINGFLLNNRQKEV